MPLTRDFKETIRARVERDPKFRKELLREGVEAMLAGDVATAKTILRDYINATVGFTDLAEATKISIRSLAAIEQSDFRKLPGGIYNTSYIRQYARAIEYDECALIAFRSEEHT